MASEAYYSLLGTHASLPPLSDGSAGLGEHEHRKANGLHLPVLRSDLELIKPTASPGAPMWTLHDPLRSRFYRLGWLQFEMLVRWDIGDPASIVKTINKDTTLTATLTDLEKFTQWLLDKELFRANSGKAYQLLVNRKQGGERSLLQMAFSATMFIRRPLVNPDTFLTHCNALLQPAYRRKNSIFTLFVLIALISLISVFAHIHEFRSSFAQFSTPSGFVLFLAVLAFSNVIHECGHGLIAKHYGCRVPVIGVALIFMLPVAYSDTTDAWRLASRRQKLWINAGGLLAEFVIAVLAMIAWVILPEGLARSLAFFLCISTMTSTLLINLNPFMKFDGYYLLSDYLQIDNMQARSFAILRWRLRHAIIGGKDAAPFPVSEGKRKHMYSYALCTWLYRIVLYFSIVWMVYTFWFKLLGIVLAIGVLHHLIVKPVFKEILVYAAQIKAGSWSGRSGLSLMLFLVLILVFIIPLPRQINAPALISSEDRLRLYSPAALRVQRVLVGVGDRVKSGDVLLELGDPALRLQEAMLLTELKLMNQRIGRENGRIDLAPDKQTSMADIISKQAELSEVQQAIAGLHLRSSFDGQVVAIADAALAGTWADKNRALIDVATPQRLLVRAYLPAADADRVRGSKGYFRAHSDRKPVALSLQTLHRGSIQQLSDTALAISEGGVIATRKAASPREGVRHLPLQEWRLAELEPEGELLLFYEKTGFVSFEAEPKSILASGIDRMHGVLLRESGF